MKTGSHVKSVCCIVVGLGLGLFIASTGQAQVIHPDQIIGVPSPQSEIGGGESPISEPAASDTEKGFDRQMMVPESESSGSLDMNMKTPDAADAENVSESDSRSSVSF